MHEFSLAQALLDQVNDLRRLHGAAHVVALRVEIGEFSGVEPVCLQSAFEVLTDGTGVPELELHIVPLVVRCKACSAETTVRQNRFCCEACDGTQLTALRGEGLVLRDVTLEEDA